MKKSIILCMLFALMGSMTMQAQNKAEQVKKIRQVYADAKKRIAENGKEKAALDVIITNNDTTEVSEDYIIESEYTQKLYFSKVPTSDGYFKNVPYFISCNSSENGHTMYREFLYDPQKGHLLFSYMKGETHAGFVVESRYYYDAKGGLVDQKHKVAGQDATPNAHSWSAWDTDLEMGKKMLQQFEMLMEREDGHGMTKGNKKLNTTKADRLKMIRSNYTKAKNEVAKLDKSEFATGVTITIHDQDGVDMPPLTKTNKFYFDYVSNGKEMIPHCYFFSEQYNSMYMYSYQEFLFDPKSDDLIFFFDGSDEEGMHFETRLYYDANGKCIESKQSTDIDDFEFFCDSQRAKAKKMLKVFRSVFN